MSFTENEDTCMTPEQRMTLVAGILAKAILRLHSRAALSPAVEPEPVPKNSVKSEQTRLEVPGETRLTVHTG